MCRCRLGTAENKPAPSDDYGATLRFSRFFAPRATFGRPLHTLSGFIGNSLHEHSTSPTSFHRRVTAATPPGRSPQSFPSRMRWPPCASMAKGGAFRASHHARTGRRCSTPCSRTFQKKRHASRPCAGDGRGPLPWRAGALVGYGRRGLARGATRCDGPFSPKTKTSGWPTPLAEQLTKENSLFARGLRLKVGHPRVPWTKFSSMTRTHIQPSRAA